MALALKYDASKLKCQGQSPKERIEKYYQKFLLHWRWLWGFGALVVFFDWRCEGLKIFCA